LGGDAHGSSDAIYRAPADFAEPYADQNERDAGDARQAVDDVRVVVDQLSALIRRLERDPRSARLPMNLRG
jgi:hypothetical protein